MKRTKEQISQEKQNVERLLRENPDITVAELRKSVDLHPNTLYSMPSIRNLVNVKSNKYYEKIRAKGYKIHLTSLNKNRFYLYLLKDNVRVARFVLPQNGRSKEDMLRYLPVAKSFTKANEVLKEVSQYIEENDL